LWAFILAQMLKNIKEIEMREIPNYEGLYAVTSCGKVWSYRSKRFLTPRKSKKGYLTVLLCNKGNMREFKIHRLVADAYIPNPDNLPEVNHINRDILDNTVENLEWVSKDFNIQHSLLKREALVAIYKLALKENITPSELIIKLVSNYTH
jgi:hypothetical protein